jgi:hypothetical protein
VRVRYRVDRLCFSSAGMVSSSSWTKFAKRLVDARKLKELEQRS